MLWGFGATSLFLGGLPGGQALAIVAPDRLLCTLEHDRGETSCGDGLQRRMCGQSKELGGSAEGEEGRGVVQSEGLCPGDRRSSATFPLRTEQVESKRLKSGREV